ncbi:hypothetical protein [Ruminococcus sp.]|uniref:hypothetical protein n=1 Tax=Ruminococcus sp. TaxID=41978 RepID=UPI0025F10198|nr:hypothetical protein [Ruminococcus sp.]MCR4638643.1 hypothetical protein [Ruminococcus sp.]
MDLLNILTSLAQISDAEHPSIFPFGFSMHIALAIISVVFFAYRFATQKRPFQLIFAIAVPISLALWISDNKTLFYTVGLIEFILILAAFISTFICKPKNNEKAGGDDKKTEEK